MGCLTIRRKQHYLRLDVALNVAVASYGHEGLFVDARVAALVERVHLQLEIAVLLNYLLRVGVRVEGVHKHERHVHMVRLVQELQPDDTQLSASIDTSQ